MTRVAEASARAGLPASTGDGSPWERDQETAALFLAGRAVPKRAPAAPPVASSSTSPAPPPAASPVTSKVPPVAPMTVPERPARPASADTSGSDLNLGSFELASLVRRLFLESTPPVVRSLLFCTAGERTTDVAWQAARLLAQQSGRPVALVEDGSTPARSGGEPPPADGMGLVKRIGWYPSSSNEPHARTATRQQPDAAVTPDVVGDRVSDLFREADFVILNAAAPDPEDLVPLAREVDGTLLIVTENQTQHDSARALVSALREAQANVLGAVFVHE